MSTTTLKLPFHLLPLAPTTLQQTLPTLPLAPQPSSQRRHTKLSPSTPGIWARTTPLWSPWPIRITKEEVEALGVDVSKGEQVDVEDVLRRWDPVEEDIQYGQRKEDDGIKVMSSTYRKRAWDEDIDELLGISEKTLEDCLPHLDVGDAVRVCAGEQGTLPTKESRARGSLTDVLSGISVLMTPESAGEGSEKAYGPWSTRYVGHQFGSYAGQLGDGRAISLFETISEGGGRQEIQLKGAGRTPFSRTADGLAVLRSGVREYLGCEAVAALNIPTTRSLALLTSPSVPVIRENGPEPSSLLARLAPSFIRIGHFQALNPGKDASLSQQMYFGGSWARGKEMQEETHGNMESLRGLVAWCRDEIYGGVWKGKSTEEWVEEIIRRNAEMVAAWQVYGYCHGVLNTDNISILGLTIDYGPYAFMDVFDESHICNHSDPSGLYSYRNQPSRILFALDKLVTSLSPLIGYETAHSATATSGWSDALGKEELEDLGDKGLDAIQGWDKKFWEIEKDAERQGWRKRLGLKTYKSTDDRDVVKDLLIQMNQHSMDMNITFRRLSHFKPSRSGDTAYLASFASDLITTTTTGLKGKAKTDAEQDLARWLDVYGQRVLADEWVEQDGDWEEKRGEYMKSVNPRFVLRQWVLEEIIADLEKWCGEDMNRARKRLAQILDMSTYPFRSYGEDGADDAESKEWARLCGLGKKEMLGFQCSCSS